MKFANLTRNQCWDAQGKVDSSKVRYLNKSDLKDSLKSEKVRFVVANVGYPPDWILVETCYEFWKSEVKDRCAENGNEIVLENYPDEYAHVASQWEDGSKFPIILLQMHH